MTTLKARLAKFPPFLCIALSKVACDARSGKMRSRVYRRRLNGEPLPADHARLYRRITREEVASRGKLSVKCVQRLTQAMSWQAVQVPTMLAFLLGCGLELGSDSQMAHLLYREMNHPHPFGHLDRKQYRLFLRRMEDFNKVRTSAAA